MLFISYAKKPEPKRPPLPFKTTRKVLKIRLTRKWRRALFSDPVFGLIMRGRILGINKAQSIRLSQEFWKTEKGGYLKKCNHDGAVYLRKLMAGKADPKAFDTKTKKRIIKCYESQLNYWTGLLSFVKQQKGVYKYQIGTIEEREKDAAKMLADLKRTFGIK